MGDWYVDEKRAKLIGVEYNRNGIGGAGFYRIDFEYDNESLIGIVYPHEKELTAVIMPSEILRNFRGADYFGAWLWEQAGTLYGSLDEEYDELHEICNVPSHRSV